MSLKNQFLMRIDTDNAAFDDPDDGALEACMDSVCARLRNGKIAGTILDANGNTIGEYVWTRTKQ